MYHSKTPTPPLVSVVALWLWSHRTLHMRSSVAAKTYDPAKRTPLPTRNLQNRPFITFLPPSSSVIPHVECSLRLNRSAFQRCLLVRSCCLLSATLRSTQLLSYLPCAARWISRWGSPSARPRRSPSSWYVILPLHRISKAYYVLFTRYSCL